MTRGWRRAPPLRSSQSHPPARPDALHPNPDQKSKTQFLMPLQKGGQRPCIRYCRFCLGNDEVGWGWVKRGPNEFSRVSFAPRTASQARGHHSIPPPTRWSGLIGAGCLDSSSAHTAVGVCVQFSSQDWRLCTQSAEHTPSQHTHPHTHTPTHEQPTLQTDTRSRGCAHAPSYAHAQARERASELARTWTCTHTQRLLTSQALS